MYRIVIVDDEEEIRRGLASHFPWEELGYSVVATAENGVEALDLARQGRVDVIFSDIRMPIMSGIDLAKCVAEERLGVAIVFLSAYRDFSYAKKALEYGVKRYVLKPTDYAEIRSVFRRLKTDMDRRVKRPVEGESGTDSTGSTNAERRRAAAVARIKEYIEREFAHATLEHAAAIVQKNPQHVSRLFKQATGVNFSDYLTRTRMEKAAQLLTDFSYLTYQVSEFVGYSDPKNFTRTFRRHFGVPPRVYRRGKG